MPHAPAAMPPEIHPSANVYRSEIGEGTRVAAFVEIGGARIGARCKVQAFAFICPGVVLADEVFVGPHACFTNDRFPRAVGAWQRETTMVEIGASIGARSLILPGVTIGAGAMVAAGAVVTTSVPAGYLYDRTPGAPSRRWFRSQEELGLPYTFDEWRLRYAELSCTEQQAFYDALYEKFPEQDHAAESEVRQFFRSLPPVPISVIEIGGWDGHTAAFALHEFPQIEKWHNYEICGPAIMNGFADPRYVPVLPQQFVWELDDLPLADVFFASHVIEHVTRDQLKRLIARLERVTYVYLQAPLPASAVNHSWQGRWNTHILELGWEQIEDLFARHGFQVTYRAPDIRWLERQQ